MEYGEGFEKGEREATEATEEKVGDAGAGGCAGLLIRRYNALVEGVILAVTMPSSKALTQRAELRSNSVQNPWPNRARPEVRPELRACLGSTTPRTDASDNPTQRPTPWRYTVK